MKFADLPLVNHTMDGYERLWAFPANWPMWSEPDGATYALTFEHVRSRPENWSAATKLCKEQIPREIFEANR
mgnify:CR=1 FL=1